MRGNVSAGTGTYQVAKGSDVRTGKGGTCRGINLPRVPRDHSLRGTVYKGLERLNCGGGADINRKVGT